MENIRIGDEISFHFGFAGVFKHVGLCADFHPLTGEPMVAHNSSRFGGVRISSLSEFSGGRAVSVRSVDSPLGPASIQQMIRDLIGKTYDAVNYNCEHFVSEALGHPPRSAQVAIWLGVGLIGGVALLAASSRR